MGVELLRLLLAGSRGSAGFEGCAHGEPGVGV